MNSPVADAAVRYSSGTYQRGFPFHLRRSKISRYHGTNPSCRIGSSSPPVRRRLRGGVEDQQASHRLMFQRVGWQALTVLLILVLGLLLQFR